MLDVAIRQRIIQLQIINVKRTIRKRVAFVRIVVEVFRVCVIGLKLESMAESLSHARSDAAIEPLADAACDKDFTELWAEKAAEAWTAVNVQKARQVHTL